MANRARIRALGAWPIWIFWLGTCASLGVAACFLPLLQTLGHELAIAVALAASLGAGHVAATMGPRLRAGRWALGARTSSFRSLAVRAFAVGLSLLAAPLALSLVNGLRVPPCNIAEGLAFFALDAVFGALAASAVGLALGFFFRRGRDAALAWFAVWLASLAVAVLTFYATPAVFVYGPFFGYFPGVLYDTLIEIRTPFLTYRLVTLVDIGAILFAAAAAFDPTALRLGFGRMCARPAASAIAGVLVAAAIALHALGPHLGHAARRGDLERALPVHVVEGRLDLYFPTAATREEVADLSADAAFSLYRVESFLAPEAGGRISVFFFPSRAVKGRVMGASRTNVAKPWRAEVYVVMDDVPHEVLRHELAHAVAASFGSGPFDIAAGAGGLLPNPGIIEGVAVAAEGPRGELTHHQWAAAMKRLDLLPRLGRAMGLEFFDFNASTVYTATGSFFAWLREGHGAAAVRSIYGGATFRKATGRSLGELEEEWQGFLDGVPLDRADLEAASLRFDRPSVIRSTCVHEVARLEEEADERFDEGDADGAIAALEAACGRSGGATDSRYELFRGLAAARDVGAVRAMAQELLASSQMSGARRVQIAEVLADLDAEEGKCDSAADAYARIASDAASDDVRRRTQVKRHLCAEGLCAERAILGALSAVRSAQRPPDALAALRIGEIASSRADPWLDYLAGRQHFRYREYAEALRWLDAADRDGFDGTTAEIRTEGQMLRGRALFQLRRFDEARAVFDALAGAPGVREGARELAADWVARCDFESREGRNS